MNDEPVFYGQLRSEKVAEENLICRQIAREISLFGISERQRMLVIYLLAMEVENQEVMRSITSTIKELVGKELFLSGQEVLNGTSDV